LAHVIAAAVALTLMAPASARAQTPAGSRILVVPFENVQREPKLYWLSEASAMLLAARRAGARL
jgi:TolB-like protein